jgi:hypothetical protein
VLSSLPIAHEDSGTEDPRWVDKGGLQNIGRLGHFPEEFQILWNLSLIQKKKFGPKYFLNKLKALETTMSSSTKKRIRKFEKFEEIRVPTSNQCFSFQHFWLLLIFLM